MRVVIVIFLFLFSCSNDDNIKEVPECLRPIIVIIQEKPVQSPKASIEKYLYYGQEVYQVNGQNFPDGQSHVIMLNCEDICVLGGIDGSNNDCPEWQNAEFIETIWVDPR